MKHELEGNAYYRNQALEAEIALHVLLGGSIADGQTVTFGYCPWSGSYIAAQHQTETVTQEMIDRVTAEWRGGMLMLAAQISDIGSIPSIPCAPSRAYRDKTHDGEIGNRGLRSMLIDWQCLYRHRLDAGWSQNDADKMIYARDNG